MNRDFLRSPLPRKSACAHVEVFVIFTNDHHVDLLRPLVLDRGLDTGVQTHRAEIHILMKSKSKSEQNSLFEHARGNTRMPHCAEEDCIAATQIVLNAIRKDFAGAEKPLAAKVEMDQFMGKANGRRNIAEYRKSLAGDFGSNAITCNHADRRQLLPPACHYRL